MLRRILLYLSGSGWMKSLTAHFWLARRVARRFVAGEKLEEALAAARTLNDRGLLVTLDYLGESVHKAEDTRLVVAMYRRMIEAISLQGLQASVSLKLTHLGLDIGETLCINNLREILYDASEYGIRVTIDMESSDYTEQTLQIYRTLRDKEGLGIILGTVIQAALRRSNADMTALAAEGARIRLCKGAYLEPTSVAYTDKAEVDQHFVHCMESFFTQVPPAVLEIATHDEAMIAAALLIIEKQHITPDAYEFQMLYGIRSDRQLELVASGHQMRVYVPFGESWYPYFMRRLAERPANLWFFLRALVG